jgi:hypothetical protein
MDEPEIASSLPDAALNPLIFPEKFPTKNHSGVTCGGGGGLIDELPPPHPTAIAPSNIAASAASFGFTDCLRATSGVVSCFNPDVFGSQRIVYPFPLRRNPLSIPRSGYLNWT